ncbi:MAG TPA: hypothetical protein VEB59_16015 [Gemmatimonadales bacterium]|nr:hypothetical protein [Gemmatimonadales bacterium]
MIGTRMLRSRALAGYPVADEPPIGQVQEGITLAGEWRLNPEVPQE